MDMNMENTSIDELMVDWGNEDAVRYLSAINCIHNYTLGKVFEMRQSDVRQSDVKAGSDLADSNTRKKSSCKGFLTFSNTVEHIFLLDSEKFIYSSHIASASRESLQDSRQVEGQGD